MADETFDTNVDTSGAPDTAGDQYGGTVKSIGSAVPIIGPIWGGVIGAMTSAADKETAFNLAQTAYQLIQDTGLPPNQAFSIAINQYKSAGQLNPTLEKAFTQGVSQMSQVQEDPALRAAQMSALQGIGQKAQLGLSPQDQATLADIRNRSSADAQSRTNQILQNMQQRGIAGGGAELAARLSSNQAADQSAAQQSLQQGGIASQNALAALAQYGGQAGQLRSQDFGANSARAQAQDQMNRFNIGQQTAAQSYNVGEQNQAQKANLANAQAISNANTQQNNQEVYRQLAAQQQYWQNLLGYNTASANAKLGQAGQYANRGNASAEGAQKIGSGIGAAAGAMMSQQPQNGYVNLLPIDQANQNNKITSGQPMSESWNYTDPEKMKNPLG